MGGRVFVCVLLLVPLTLATNATDDYDSLTGGNALWTGILRDCKVPTVSCIQKNAFEYLDSVFRKNGDVTLGEWLHFKENSLLFEANTNDTEERSLSPIEEVTEALRDKSVTFMMNHDVEMQLPDAVFDGATFKISPRSLEDDGVVVKLDLTPRHTEIARKDEGRIFFKKIKKFFKNKLLMAFLSVLLVLKLIKVKLLFIAPLIVGVGTAKKIILKVLLFLFPALTHLFKLCSYYHDNYHTKFHHHHHQIAHVHHMPSLHHSPEIHSHPIGPVPYRHEHDGFEFSGPGLGPEYISNRNTYDHMPNQDADENEIKSWGLAQGQRGTRRGQTRGTQPPSAQQVEMLAAQAEKEVMLKARLQQEQLRLRQENIRLQEQLKQELKLQDQLKLQALVLAQHKAGHVAKTPAYDPFYSPILKKIDTVFAGLGVHDEPCRERLVCSMYKNPVKFSPHSNLISAELSRDSKDLQKPTSNNEAVVRFYRYVQAARDGQDKRDCLRLYPSCSINTEK